MSLDTFFVDVIIPLSIPNLYTYRVPFELNEDLLIGQRVIVPFGRGGKLYSALIKNIHSKPPEYHAKYIDSILDETPIVNQYQLKHWNWIQDYYIASPGEVFNAALPGGLKLASETKVVLNRDFDGDAINDLSDKEYLIYEALEVKNILSLQEISEITFVKNVHKFIKSLIEKQVIIVEEELKRKYKPKVIQFVRLTEYANDEKALEEIFNTISRAKKQLEILMTYIKLSNRYNDSIKEVKKIELQKATNSTSSLINQMVAKNIFEIYDVEVDRIGKYGNELIGEKTLNEYQVKAYNNIKTHFKEKDVVLLHGVTASGKTEIYIKLIKEAIDRGEQILYLLPEIALTTQLIKRLQKVFGDSIGVYHSKFNENERVEVWNSVLNFETTKSSRFQIVMGARSAMFLPYSNLGLVIIDEEHENTFKQYDPSPRYHARDASVVLAKIHQAKVLMGSATPAIETYYNALEGKYGLVEINKRHGGVMMPEILCADIKEATRKKKMKAHFSPLLMELMEEAFENKEQVILFQNRRGYAPFMLCEECGNVPECKNCDVSLTYHKFTNLLKCHYCGASKKMPPTCTACGSPKITLKGFGTEQIEEELALYFPKIKIARMDLDTTRAKNAYSKIITDFEDRNIDVLVGTQMVTKGLDFDNVSLVGILNADNMLNFPDFRAFERSYQLMSQVSGRAGRKQKRGKVLIQSYDPYHPIIRQVIDHDYMGMYKSEIIQRRNFKYPPFQRIIHFTLKHRDKDKLNAGAKEFTDALKTKFGERILGPEFPAISRVKNMYIKNVLLKVEREISVPKTRNLIVEVKQHFEAYSDYKSMRITIDVDPM